MLKKLIVFFLIALAFKGCTRDDLCSGDTATTPLLIVTFKDVVNPTNNKTVVGLSVETDYENSVEVIARTDIDSIALPLNTNSDTTRYRFIRTTISTLDTLVNIDTLMFLYQRNNIYVNRACGFKSQYVGLSADLEPGSNNWIQSILVIRDTVKDETKAHINILH